MAKSTGTRGSGKGGKGGKVDNLPSKTVKPSGKGRGNAQPRRGQNK